MKINKYKPSHWLSLALFTANTLLALILRPFFKKSEKTIILLYGHKLNGNLKSLYDVIIEDANSPFDIYFLTMDISYYKILRRSNIKAILAINPSNISLISRSLCIVSDHGIHCLELLLKYSSIKFVDVWHGIPFKGFDGDDFKIQHRFDQIWVSSNKLKQMYIEKFNFAESKVKVTGYGRTDRLINQSKNIHKIKRKLSLPQDNRKVILFAPTWQQDNKKRSIFPFNVSEKTFNDTLIKICHQYNAIGIFRTHLNSGLNLESYGDPFYFIPHDQHPNTEEILIISDIMICDWSSIAFDFLVLNRPTIFLDVPPPFSKGFSLGPEYRFGKIVKNLENLKNTLEEHLTSTQYYNTKCSQYCHEIKKELYDYTLDGVSAQRYEQQLRNLTQPPP